MAENKGKITSSRTFEIPSEQESKNGIFSIKNGK